MAEVHHEVTRVYTGAELTPFHAVRSETPTCFRRHPRPHRGVTGLGSPKAVSSSPDVATNDRCRQLVAYRPLPRPLRRLLRAGSALSRSSSAEFFWSISSSQKETAASHPPYSPALPESVLAVKGSIRYVRPGLDARAPTHGSSPACAGWSPGWIRSGGIVL